jgi:membrane protease YdiL (CAAX protease family)
MIDSKEVKGNDSKGFKNNWFQSIEDYFIQLFPKNVTGLFLLFFTIILGFILLDKYGISKSSNTYKLWLIAAGLLMFGVFWGFIFGIPKNLQKNKIPDNAPNSYRGNTNLEEISDWITKIVVGIYSAPQCQDSLNRHHLV